MYKRQLAEVIAFQEGQPAKLHMLPRTEKARKIGQKTIDVDNQFFFHHVNAFEPEGIEDASRVVIDSAPWRYMNFAVNLDTVTPAFYNGGMRVEYTRFDVDVVKGASAQESLSNRVMEFPSINHKNTGKPYRFTYCAGSAVKDDVKWGPNQCLIKFDTDTKVGAKSDAVSYTHLTLPTKA